MHVYSSPAAIKSILSDQLKEDKSLGLVPTMGALHEGHLTLVKKSLAENDLTVVSIFVNPIQFNSKEDLDNYPKDFEADLNLLKSYNVDYVFCPDEKDLYPTAPLVSINFGNISHLMEGKFRKGHFEGVGVIVCKLLNLLSPNTAYFGLKDLQQFLLIKRMCEDLNFRTRIVGVETVREKSGLAMSSRNRRLSDHGKEIASLLYKGLKSMEEGVFNRLSVSNLVHDANDVFRRSDLIQIEYLEVVDPSTLEPVDSYEDMDELAICVAGYVEGIRLIDNLYLRLK